LTWKGKWAFTLLEMIICVVILSAAAVTVSWQMRGMFQTHHYHQNVDRFLTDLQKCQLIALSDRIDIEIRIEKGKQGYQYTVHTDEPISHFSRKREKMKGIEQMKVGKKGLDSHVITIYRTGVIRPSDPITLYLDEKVGTALKLAKSPTIEIEKVDRRQV